MKRKVTATQENSNYTKFQLFLNNFPYFALLGWFILRLAFPMLIVAYEMISYSTLEERITISDAIPAVLLTLKIFAVFLIISFFCMFKDRTEFFRLAIITVVVLFFELVVIPFEFDTIFPLSEQLFSVNTVKGEKIKVLQIDVKSKPYSYYLAHKEYFSTKPTITNIDCNAEPIELSSQYKKHSVDERSCVDLYTGWLNFPWIGNLRACSADDLKHAEKLPLCKA